MVADVVNKESDLDCAPFNCIGVKFSPDIWQDHAVLNVYVIHEIRVLGVDGRVNVVWIVADVFHNIDLTT